MYFKLAIVGLLTFAGAAHSQKEHGFDNTKPSGQPYLTPAESLKRMKVADGFEVKLFAAEPMVVNPIAFTIDERGRVWVVESFEYPSRTPKGKMPRDRIVILEDTDGDGAADKRTVFAEGNDFPERFDLASGIEVGYGGVFLGAPPNLWFIENKNDKPGKFEKLLGGFGSQDTHETLNTFQWGPDGWLYGLHGIFTQSEVSGPSPPAPLPQSRERGENKGDPAAQARDKVKLNAGVWRYHPRTRKFEVFAEGTSNPWGWDYRNTDGQMILCCCVIPHLFHIVPGGIYKRQAGTSMNPYAYGELNEICDHTFHKESGWAHAGLLSLDTPIVPPEFRDSVIFGSIHGCSLKRNVLKRNGSTFTASRADDFLVSGDKNFRPINLRWGPNADIYLSDWHDQNPCHQAKPEDWDYARGRIYRIQQKGATTKKAEDLGRTLDSEFEPLLRNTNCYVRRTAQRLAFERKAESSAATGPSTDKAIESLELLAQSKDPPYARLELINITRHYGYADTTKVLHTLMSHKQDAIDPVIPFMLWLAYEPKLAAKPPAELDWLQANASGNPLITDHIIPRAMRRLVATGKGDDLNACVAFVAASNDAVRHKALEGLAEALKGRQVDAPSAWAALAPALAADPATMALAQKLAVSFRDPAAGVRAMAAFQDVERPIAERAEAARQLASLKPPTALTTLLFATHSERDPALRLECCRALAAFDGSQVSREVLRWWKRYSPAERGALVGVLAGNKAWARELLAAVAIGDVARSDLNANVIMRMTAFKDATLNSDIERVWGKLRDTPSEIAKLIDKMRGDLEQAPGSFVKGKAIFDAQCAKCHKFDGRGYTVGPALDGAGRDVEYLLVNVLDPNRVIGQPYFVRRLSMKKGTIEEGLLHEEDGQKIALKGENDAVRVFAKNDVETIDVIERSMMPEGLGYSMTTQDFRDLVRYAMASPFIDNWHLSGPFAQRVKENLTTDGPGLGDNKWHTVRAGASGRVTLPSVAKPSFVYLWTTVSATRDFATRLELGGGHIARAWLNGKEVANAAAELKMGVNKLLIEVSYSGDRKSIAARFLDPDRKIIHD